MASEQTAHTLEESGTEAVPYTLYDFPGSGGEARGETHLSLQRGERLRAA